MQITIDTENLTALDVLVLRMVLGDAETPTPAPAAASPSAAKPVKKAAAKAEPVVEPEPEPEPEPEDDDLVGGTAPTMADAVARATELVGSGDAPRVKAALTDLGVKKVSELKSDDDIAAFVAALED